MDTVGEFLWATDRPELGQDRGPCEGENRSLWPLGRIRQQNPLLLTPLRGPAMKRPRVRFTLRQMMILTAGVGLMTWLFVAADQIRREPDSSTLCHLRRYSDNGEPFSYGHASTSWIFWSKYWRR